MFSTSPLYCFSIQLLLDSSTHLPRIELLQQHLHSTVQIANTRLQVSCDQNSTKRTWKNIPFLVVELWKYWFFGIISAVERLRLSSCQLSFGRPGQPEREKQKKRKKRHRHCNNGSWQLAASSRNGQHITDTQDSDNRLELQIGLLNLVGI